MNKYQQALENMKHHIVGVPVLKWYYKKDADTLQELVDRATPKKCEKHLTYDWFVCPNCKEEIYFDTDYGQQKFNCCSNCGQALNWTNESEQIAKGEMK